jgi:hypothetical protein
VTVSGGVGGSSNVSLAWTGSEYGVAWENSRSGNDEIYFARLSAVGGKIGEDVLISESSEDSGYPSLSWAGSGFGLVWHEVWDPGSGHIFDREADVYFTYLSYRGERMVWPARQITDSPGRSYYPVLEWTGSEFGLSWSDEWTGFFEIYFVRLTAGGDRIGSDVPITSTGIISHMPDMVWTGSEYGMVWEDGRYGAGETYLARLMRDGTIIGGDVKVGDLGTDSHVPSVAWTGSEFGVAWYKDEPSQDDIYFTRIGFCE